MILIPARASSYNGVGERKRRVHERGAEKREVLKMAVVSKTYRNQSPRLTRIVAGSRAAVVRNPFNLPALIAPDPLLSFRTRPFAYIVCKYVCKNGRLSAKTRL